MAFLATADALKELGFPGRGRILGTPAEEGGDGKVRFIEAGAFDPQHDIAAAIMAHDMSTSLHRGSSKDICDGLVGFKLAESYKMCVEFRRQAAHLAVQPWNGVNALDVVAMAYNNVSVLRQQIQPDQPIHGIIEHGGTILNVIPQYALMNWFIRASTTLACEHLFSRLKRYCEAAALASGCEVCSIP